MARITKTHESNYRKMMADAIGRAPADQVIVAGAMKKCGAIGHIQMFRALDIFKKRLNQDERNRL